MVTDQTLNDILLMLAPLHRMPGYIGVRDDYIIETSLGCFRVAYSPRTHCTALFYARHPDDLAPIPDETGAYGIAHKERLILISMYKVHHGADRKWNYQDPRQQFDLTWVRREVVRTMHDMPRIQFREANLHHIAAKVVSSVFVAYQERQSEKSQDEARVDVITKTNQNFQLPTVRLSKEETEFDHPEQSHLPGQFRKISRDLLHRMHASSFPLRSVNSDTNEITTSIPKSMLPDARAADFAIRLEQIWRGLDPVLWRDDPLLPISRAAPVLREKFSGLSHSRKEGVEDFARQLGAFGLHLAFDGPLSFITNLFIDKAGDFGKKERLGNVPHEWCRIVDRNARRLLTIDSALHRTLFRPEPQYFGDLSWINPEQHLCDFATSPEDMITPDPDHTFKLWSQSHFLAPYGNSFEYRGDDYELLSPAQLSEIRVIQVQVSNGILLYYVHETGKLYVHYNEPDYLTLNRKLPIDADHYLRANEVIEIDLKKNDEAMRRISFKAFQIEIGRATKTPDLILPPADKPKPDVMNPALGPQATAYQAPKSKGLETKPA